MYRDFLFESNTSLAPLSLLFSMISLAARRAARQRTFSQPTTRHSTSTSRLAASTLSRTTSTVRTFRNEVAVTVCDQHLPYSS